ncbi:PaaI family thioesterase [Sphingomonas sp. TX0543]|uniref:PaaI family thioesterase n=1 Tax=Sphingomonas sp. TX0543 TaxID=3399682 RepID=UPI003AFB7874
MTDHDEGPDGLAQLQAMLAGGLKAPIGDTLGFELAEVERGRVVFEGKPDRSVYNPLGSVHGGYAATLLDSACGIATHSALGANRGHTTLELKVSYLRALSEDSGTVRATRRGAPSRSAAASPSPRPNCTTARAGCVRPRRRRCSSSMSRRLRVARCNPDTGDTGRRRRPGLPIDRDRNGSRAGGSPRDRWAQ